MKLNARCMQCMVDAQAALLSEIEDENVKADYFRKVLRTVALGSFKPLIKGVSAKS